MNASNYFENVILNLIRGIPYTPPAAVFAALYISSPTDADTGTEVSGGGYARQQIVFGEPIQIGGKAQILNSNKVEFSTATGAWGTVPYLGIRDAANGGNLIVWGPLSQAKDVQIGDQIVIQVNDSSVSVD
jgi:hypothetical protein